MKYRYAEGSNVSVNVAVQVFAQPIVQLRLKTVAIAVQNVDGNRGVVVWIPLHVLRPEHGPVEVCPESQRGGHIEIVSSGKADYSTSEQYEIPPHIIDRYHPCAVAPRPGDALLFHMHMFHRSGPNTSNEIRFVAGVRFHTMTADDFLPGRPQYAANVKVLARRNARFGRNDT